MTMAAYVPSTGHVVLVVPTGTANIASVFAAFRRLGADPRLAGRPEDIRNAGRLVVPGVGSFGAAMERLNARNFAESLRERLEANRPTLGFCVGHQLMFRSSDENPGARGLGQLKGHVGRFPAGARVPQFGWNRIEPEPGCRFLTPGYAYFANSFRVARPPQGCRVAWAEHGGRFVAGIERGGILGCQFHPELSGQYGRELLARWMEGADG